MTMRTIGAMSLNHYEKVLQVGSKKNIYQERRNKYFVVLLFLFHILSTQILLYIVRSSLMWSLTCVIHHAIRATVQNLTIKWAEPPVFIGHTTCCPTSPFQINVSSSILPQRYWLSLPIYGSTFVFPNHSQRSRLFSLYPSISSFHLFHKFEPFHH